MGMVRHSGRAMRGFTLVELMISTAIIGLLSSVVLVALHRSQIAKEAEGDVRTVAAALREAQNYALTGRGILQTAGKPCMFRVRAEADSGTILIEQANVGIGDVCDGGFTVGEEIPLSRNGRFAARSVVSFPVPRAEPLTEGGSELIGSFVDFAVANRGKVAHACVYPLGRIEERLVGESCSE